ncbi:GNAT family N-acetyltransferase [Pantoea vagans]|uniref:GNAT family N-acetyltransferase n=1 Tax=Pantoea vagans TaxID=470934 RepID=UPI0023B0615B|nr:GNAT family N-acetyltransferase [Pantoea vagans]MDE8557820.1 GNAT family N-acetyltransferase [Pantoea vagans]MDE8577388.1 GNAT family N-acetyltransferase [Pantoea vagans]
MFYISEVNKSDSELGCLVNELDMFLAELYPAGSNHSLDLSTVSDENLRCLMVGDKEGISAGCGAVLFQETGFGEIKRIYICPEFRGRKPGELIIGSLEQLARENRCHQSRLETGIHQQPAIVS